MVRGGRGADGTGMDSRPTSNVQRSKSKRGISAVVDPDTGVGADRCYKGIGEAEHRCRGVWHAKRSKLRNEANYLGCYVVWIGLMDKRLATQVRHFDSWLRFVKLGLFWGVNTRSGLLRQVVFGRNEIEPS